LPLLAAIGQTLELFDPVRPVEEKITALDEPFVSNNWGYSIRPPMWWKVQFTRDRNEVVVGQSDYFRAGMLEPQVRFLAETESEPAEACAKARLERLEDQLKKDKADYRVLRQGPAKMAKLEGYEFLVRRDRAVATTQPATPLPPLIFARRTVCSGGISYSLQLLYQTEKVEDVVEAMEAIAAGVELFPPTTTAPTTTAPGVVPTPSTAPAPPIAPATRPTTAPGGVIVPKYAK
jgi:hypothetical protein